AHAVILSLSLHDALPILFRALGGVATAKNRRANAVRITESDNAVTADQRHHRVTTAHPGMHPLHRFENDLWGWLQLLLFLQFVRDRKSTRLNSSHVKISY